MELGNFGKHVLLTGAGFSKNWGGYDATEMRRCIRGHLCERTSEDARKLLDDNWSFETTLAKSRNGEVSKEAAQTLEKALSKAFESLNKQLGDAPLTGPTWINIYKVQEFIALFFRHRANGADPGRNATGYIFTLNQDLWENKSSLSKNWVYCKTKDLTLPGPISCSCICSHLYPRICTCKAEVEEGKTEGIKLHEKFNYIKLHGSCNWRSGGTDNPVMVIGDHKANQIRKSPLLAYYHDVFKEVLSAGEMRLMIIGYGFADEHINEVIANAVNENGLRVFIWDTNNNLEKEFRDSEGPKKDIIINGLINTECRKMIEIFPADQSNPESRKQIIKQFFGICNEQQLQHL